MKTRHNSSLFSAFIFLIVTTSFLLTQNVAISQSYCTPSYNLDDDYTAAFSVSSSSTTVNYSANSQLGVNGYNDLYADPTKVITQLTGTDIVFSHTHYGDFGLTEHTARIWVDWNGNGMFENSESMYNVYSASGTQNGSFTIPANVVAGDYRMRLRTRWDNHTNDLTPCGSYGYGQALDFKLTINAQTPCSGIPDLNSTVVSAVPSIANAGDPYNVTANNPPLNTGLTYTWQSSTDGGITWNTIGTPSSTYAHITGQIAPPNVGDVVQYRLIVACGTNSDTSNVANFTTGIVHCAPSFGTGLGFGHIKSFSTTNGVTNIINNTNAQSLGGYGDFTSTHTVSVHTNNSFNFSAEFETSVGSGFAIWIDWDKNGTFAATERVFNTTSEVTSVSNQINVSGRPPGTYRMRIMADYELGNPTDPCRISTDGGEAEDYTLVIINCETDAGTIQGADTLCVGVVVPLTSTVTNGTHKWESDNATIASIDETTGLLSALSPGSAEILYILTDANGCIDTASTNIYVEAPFTVNITDYPSNDTLYISNTFTYKSDGIAGTWTSTNSFIASIDPITGLVQAILAGTTDIVYTETSSCLINDVHTLTIVDTISSNPPPSGDSSIFTNVIDLELISSVVIFPNPATDEIDVLFTISTPTAILVDVVDLNGKIIRTVPVNNVVSGANNIKLNIADYANGIYSIILRSDTAQNTQKLVITK